MILLLELLPRLIQRRKNRSADHPVLCSRRGR